MIAAKRFDSILIISHRIRSRGQEYFNPSPAFRMHGTRAAARVCARPGIRMRKAVGAAAGLHFSKPRRRIGALKKTACARAGIRRVSASDPPNRKLTYGSRLAEFSAKLPVPDGVPAQGPQAVQR